LLGTLETIEAKHICPTPFLKMIASKKCNQGFLFVLLTLVATSSDSFRFSYRGQRFATTQQSRLLIDKISTTSLYSSTQPISDETMEEWLDDMIYCGDIEGYIRRRARDVVSEDFREYLDERLEACHDEDEKQVLSEISLLVSEKLRISDGLADSEEVFESRLDRVLFTAPNQRKAFIKDNIEEMSLGFVEFVQKEMKTTDDGDSKVVFASILQLIGQVKGADLLGSFAGILAGADSSLGDQFAPVNSLLLDGGGNLDEAKEAGTKLGDKNEQVKFIWFPEFFCHLDRDTIFAAVSAFCTHISIYDDSSNHIIFSITSS
jgi:hypothetical protein